MTRKPSRERYDAVVGLEPAPQSIPDFAFGLVKYTYMVDNGRTVLSEPEPLLHDVWGSLSGAIPLEPRLPAGSDFWFQKAATDVVVRGSAYSPGGAPIERAIASVSIGPLEKELAVFGHREVSWRRDGTPVFSSPEPVDSVPLLYQLAYGGLDARVSIGDDERAAYNAQVRAGLAYDHPGLYPRNPVGKGYLVYPGPVDRLELPNLEDPGDLLTPERLVSGGPELWYKQPLPWCFEWCVASVFPRCRFLGTEPWFPAPDGPDLPEVSRGFFPSGVPGRTRGSPDVLGYLQEASLGMSVSQPLAGLPVCVRGMNPEHSVITFTVPPPPRVAFEVDSRREAVAARATNLVIYPSEKRLTVTYAAVTSALPRGFVPGVHRDIPIALWVDDDAPLRYEAPETVMDRLLAPALA